MSVANQILDSRLNRLEQELQNTKTMLNSELNSKRELTFQFELLTKQKREIEKKQGALIQELNQTKSEYSQLEDIVRQERDKAKDAVNQVQKNTGNLRVMAKSLEAERFKATKEADNQKLRADGALHQVQSEFEKGRVALSQAESERVKADAASLEAQAALKSAEFEKQKAADSAESERRQTERLKIKVSEILNVVAEAAKGDLTKRLLTSDSDAIADVMKGLSQFFTTIQESLLTIQSQSNEVVQSSKQLLEISKTMKEAAQTTSERIQLVSTTTHEMDTKTQKVESTVHGMTEGMSLLSKEARNATEIAVKAVLTGKEARVIIIELSDLCLEIQDVSNFIAKIAAKAKMLAMNARIEASLVGEKGAGFGVVAQEIKAMANETSEATERIGATLKSVMSKAAQGLKSMDEITNVVQEMKATSETVSATVDSFRRTSDEISKDIISFTEGNSTINQSIEKLTHGALESSKAAEATELQAQNLNQISNLQNQNLSKFKLN